MGATLKEILLSHKTRRAIVMGILNVTPDSFSDGGEFIDASSAAAQAELMLADGADIIDIGAESTRPGSGRVAAGGQIARLRDIVAAVADMGALVSIDTTAHEVAEFALDAGAVMINDISAGRDDERILPLAAERNVPIVLMHMLGKPGTMQDQPRYDNVVGEVCDFLSERVAAAAAAGVRRDNCIVDPGIGFGKLLEHNLALLAATATLRELGLAVMVGPSRKRFIGELTGRSDPQDRIGGTVAACLEAYHRGASIFRVHDVAAVVDALKVSAAIDTARNNS